MVTESTALRSGSSLIGWIRCKRWDINLPVLLLEMRVRMRGARPFGVMFVYCLALSVLALGVLLSTLHNLSVGGHPSQWQAVGYGAQMSTYGRDMFISLMALQLGMVVLIVPAYTSGLVSAERERGTFGLLSLTLMPSANIVDQKLAAALMQVGVLILASIPVVSMVFLLGGVSPLEVAVTYLVVLLTAIVVGTLGTVCSCCAGRVRASSLAAYAITLLVYAGLPILGEAFPRVAELQWTDSPDAFAWSVVGVFALLSAAIAVIPFGFAMVSLHAVWPSTRTRLFRICLFGAVYAATMLILSVPAAVDALLAMFWRSGVFLPLFANPFVALFAAGTPGIGYGNPVGYLYGGSTAIVITIAASLALAILLRHFSVIKLEALRRL